MTVLTATRWALVGDLTLAPRCRRVSMSFYDDMAKAVIAASVSWISS
jgi:hypothetical protein